MRHLEKSRFDTSADEVAVAVRARVAYCVVAVRGVDVPRVMPVRAVVVA